MLRIEELRRARRLEAQTDEEIGDMMLRVDGAKDAVLLFLRAEDGGAR